MCLRHPLRRHLKGCGRHYAGLDQPANCGVSRLSKAGGRCWIEGHVGPHLARLQEVEGRERFANSGVRNQDRVHHGGLLRSLAVGFRNLVGGVHHLVGCKCVAQAKVRLLDNGS